MVARWEGEWAVEEWVKWMNAMKRHTFPVIKQVSHEDLTCSMVTVVNTVLCVWMGFPGGSDSKEPACNAGDLGSIPGLGRSPGGGHGNPLHFSCLETPHGQRSLVSYSPCGCKESDITERLSTVYLKVVKRVTLKCSYHKKGMIIT